MRVVISLLCTRGSEVIEECGHILKVVLELLIALTLVQYLLHEIM
jgi:hypothetical protein